MTTMETTSTPTRVARYSAPVPGFGTGALPVRILGDERPAALVVAVLPADECPRCRALMALGGAAAEILLESFGGDCVAPYTHSLPR